MGFIQKLFGKKPTPTPQPVAQPTAEELRKDPNMIRVFDKYGREFFITKEKWRKDILPGSIRTAWDSPDELYGVIYSTLNDGFRADVVDAAYQLFKIDTDPERGACVWGIVLTEEGRLVEAEQVLREFGKQHGERGVILTNLAKIYARRNDHAQSEAILWHGLELDPNQENAVGWYEVIYRDRDGEAAGVAALQRIAAIPGSWRPQICLARAALKANNLEQAMSLYGECLARIAKPIHSDALMQISGDMGNAGYLKEMLQLVEPYFDIPTHGVLVGNNLIKAHVDLHQLNEAQRILNQLYAQQRLDWRDNLSFWDTEIAKARLKQDSAIQVKPKLGINVGEGPVWLKPDSPAASLFPAKQADSPLVCFIGSSAETANPSQEVQQQMSDPPGRMSRALPLFFAEQVTLGTAARTNNLVPWVMEPSGGFVLMGMPWQDSEAVQLATRDGIKGDYVVVSHLNAVTDNWVVEVRLIRTSDGKRLAQFSDSFTMGAPAEVVCRMARQLRELLCRLTDIPPMPMPASYLLPVKDWFPSYLLRLEQLLAVRCGGTDDVRSDFLSGEREIVDGNIQLCLERPDSVSIRILLAQTLLAMKHVRPDILPEFKERVSLLQKERTLDEPAQIVVQQLIDDALAI